AYFLAGIHFGHAGSRFLRRACHRGFSVPGGPRTASLGQTAPCSIQARTSSTSSLVSAANLSRFGMGGISMPSTRPLTYSSKRLCALFSGTTAAEPEWPPLSSVARVSTRKLLRCLSGPWQATQDRSSSGLICLAKSTFSAAAGGASIGFFATAAGFSVVVPKGRASVSASTAQLVPAAEIHESRPWGKPLPIVGWNGYARLTTCHEPSSHCVPSRKRRPCCQSRLAVGCLAARDSAYRLCPVA